MLAVRKSMSACFLLVLCTECSHLKSGYCPSSPRIDGGTTVININGGLDSADTIARRIEKILSDRARRTGRGANARA